MSVRADVLIAAVSARAFAESAVRAGCSCRAVDAFGDLDLKALVPAVGLRRDLGRKFSPSAAAAAARGIAADAVAYGASFENHPRAVRTLAEGRQLLGNAPATLARCRDPRALAAVVAAAGERMPATLDAGETDRAERSRSWLRKPRRGGGGSGVGRWEPGTPLKRGEILQEEVVGTLASAVFLADGRRARLLGLSRQLAGEAAFGAPGFRYCGSIYPLLPAGLDATLLERRAGALADALAAAFGLVGVNGFDFVLRGEEVWVLELNPRYVASAELMERALGISIFGAHARACAGVLDAAPTPAPEGCCGKAIVYARASVVAGSTRAWLARDDIRDVPFPGDRIRRGSPVCTVYARGSDPAECRRRLEAAARTIEQELHDGTTSGRSTR